jgi:hypothetical protein
MLKSEMMRSSGWATAFWSAVWPFSALFERHPRHLTHARLIVDDENLETGGDRHLRYSSLHPPEVRTNVFPSSESS